MDIKFCCHPSALGALGMIYNGIYNSHLLQILLVYFFFLFFFLYVSDLTLNLGLTRIVSSGSSNKAEALQIC